MFTFLTGWTMVLMKLGHGVSISDGYMTPNFDGWRYGHTDVANVWFIIWPAQQLVISSAEQVAAGGDPIPEAAAAGGRAGMASRTNVLFSIPMLFFMGSASHLVWFDPEPMTCSTG